MTDLVHPPGPVSLLTFLRETTTNVLCRLNFKLREYTGTMRKKLLFLAAGFILGGALFFIRPSEVKSGNLTSASDTLSNSRFSYRAGITGTIASGTETIDIDTTDDSNRNGDINTNHLFSNDTVCFPNYGLTGCIGNRTYTVSQITDTDTFIINPVLTTGLTTTDFAVATQSARHTIQFTLATDVPSTGDILVTIPAIDITGKTNDGLPDTNGTVATNGFDLNSLATTDVSVATTTSGTCSNGDWSVAAVSAGTASADHTIRIDRSTSTCQANSTVITVTVGTGSTRMINPAPINADSHTQGQSDVYELNIKTRDGSDNTIDQVDVKVAPVESVFVSATIDETLSFKITGVSSSTSTCGQSTDITTTATSVPWASTIASTNTFYEAAHDIEASTNAVGGYVVTAVENDQLGRNGGTCTGDVGEAANCIRDTVCDGGTCTHLAAAVDDWETATNNGFGYSLQTTDGSTVAVWEYDGTAGTCDGAGTDFCAAQFADAEGPQSPVTIMSKTTPQNSNNVYVCYRISVSGTQPAGYYFNKLTYTATATF